MEEKEFPSSDDSDSDFEVNLEEELSGDSEQSDGEGSESEAGEEEKSSSKKKTKKGKTRKKRTKKSAKKTSSSNVEETDSNSKQSSDTDSKLTAEQEKERADSLWKSFLSDASIPSKSQPSTPKTTKTTKSSPSKKGNNSVETKKEETLKQEQEIGEIEFKKVEETKTKALDIREIVKPSLKSPLTSTNENGNKCKVTSPLLTQENSSKKRGISSLLGNMQKKTKLSTLEKSKLDWNQFKEEQNLQEEITTFNRGKNGYLEKQDFLQRTDTRQFELEKELRNVGRRKAR